MTNPLIDSLTRAVDTAPDDVRLRTHLAELLMDAGRSAEAVTHCAIALQHAPTDDAARALMARALSPQTAQAPAEQAASMLEEQATSVSTPAGVLQGKEDPSEAVTTPPEPESSEAPAFGSSTTSTTPGTSTGGGPRRTSADRLRPSSLRGPQSPPTPTPLSASLARSGPTATVTRPTGRWSGPVYAWPTSGV